MSETPASDSLNSLNLAIVESLETNKESAFVSEENQHTYKGFTQTSFKLSHRLRLVFTSTDRLLKTRKCRLPCFSLAQYSPNPDFVGRNDVFGLMDEHLLPREMSHSGNVQSTRLFALCGMGDIGKTDLAVEYAFTRRKEFGAVF